MRSVRAKRIIVQPKQQEVQREEKKSPLLDLEQPVINLMFSYCDPKALLNLQATRKKMQSLIGESNLFKQPRTIELYNKLLVEKLKSLVLAKSIADAIKLVELCIARNISLDVSYNCIYKANLFARELDTRLLNPTILHVAANISKDNLGYKLVRLLLQAGANPIRTVKCFNSFYGEAAIQTDDAPHVNVLSPQVRSLLFLAQFERAFFRDNNIKMELLKTAFEDENTTDSYISAILEGNNTREIFYVWRDVDVQRLLANEEFTQFREQLPSRRPSRWCLVM